MCSGRQSAQGTLSGRWVASACDLREACASLLPWRPPFRFHSGLRDLGRATARSHELCQLLDGPSFQTVDTELCFLSTEQGGLTGLKPGREIPRPEALSPHCHLNGSPGDSVGAAAVEEGQGGRFRGIKTSGPFPAVRLSSAPTLLS